MSSEIIDTHVHFGAPKDEESGCYWSDEFTNQPAYFAMLLLTKSLFKKVDIHSVKKHLFKQINGSKHVNKSVLLALDEVYDENGIVHKDKTHLHVPNDYVADLAENNDRILFGASVHPYRIDWNITLEYCLLRNAVLNKWVPSSQMIDPSHPKCIPFYKKLAEYRLPLLCHCGPQYTIPTSDKAYAEFDNPKYLRNALNEGVTVIIAHCAMPYFGDFDHAYLDDFEEFLKLFEEAEANNWNLYADLSAICSPFRIKYVEKVKENVDKIPHSKLIFASDYPIPISELCYNKSTNFFAWLKYVLKVAFMSNQLDKNYELIKGMGFDDRIFTNASELFERVNNSVI
jgi:predicted TIM-barrel fold metal-dependent hydrolase